MVQVPDNYELVITDTIQLWIAHGLIKPNAYGLVVCELVDGEWEQNDHFGVGHPDQKRSPKWYMQNADGKALICKELRMDSHTACDLFPEKVANIKGAFPHGGGVINDAGDLVVATSGGTARQDILVSSWLLNAIETRDADQNGAAAPNSDNDKIQVVRNIGASYNGPEDAPGAQARFITV